LVQRAGCKTVNQGKKQQEKRNAIGDLIKRKRKAPDARNVGGKGKGLRNRLAQNVRGEKLAADKSRPI